MLNYQIHHLITVVFIFLSIGISAQSIEGYIYNEENETIPFVHIFVKEKGSGTTSDENGYYFLSLNPGEYEFIYSAIGYETRTLKTLITDGDTKNDIRLKSSDIELDEVVVKAEKRDAAYGIIKSAIENKERYLTQFESLRSQLYIKAFENLEQKERPKNIFNQQKEILKTLDDDPEDPFEKARREKEAEMNKLNMHEVQMTLNFAYPNKFKEVRSADKLYGDAAGLFVPRFDESDFNFYKNLIQVRSITETPLVSPLSRTSILAYKFKLIEAIPEGGALIYKIKVTPRKTGNSTFKGYIYIADEEWYIKRVELSLPKGTMKAFDEFTIKQEYTELEGGKWFPYRQEFIYEAKQGRYKTFKGNTIMSFSDIEIDYPFPEKFFKNEVSVTTKEAKERDSTYWNVLRPEPLSLEQRNLVSYRDSVADVLNSKEYKDSIQQEFNKIKIDEFFYGGIGFQNHEKKQSIGITPLLGIVSYHPVGGWRFGPWASYFRRYENDRVYNTFNQVNVGLVNKDITGRTSHYFGYNPFKMASVRASLGRSYDNYNDFDAILNYFKPSRFILRNQIEIEHRFEIFNGFYLDTDINFSERKMIEGIEIRSVFSDLFEDPPESFKFDGYNAFVIGNRISYTPAQKYTTEPNRKLVLGSKYPTFSVRHVKAFKGVFGSDVDYDYVEAGIEHDLILGVFGNSRYKIRSGKFVNTNEVKFIDQIRFRESDPWWFSFPMESFQLLDTSFSTTNLFVEAHYIHHFNGALINNVPLIKKTKIAVVAGGGFLYIQDNNVQYGELFAGIERVFKIGPRRRIRLGAYGTIAQSNRTPFSQGLKFSIDVIDTYSKNWSF